MIIHVKFTQNMVFHDLSSIYNFVSQLFEINTYLSDT